MAIKKMPANLFVAELEAALKRKDGYIMGAKGQNPATLNNWYFEQYADRDNYSEKQEEKALYWKKHAARVWDCNGLAEGIYQDYTGVNINTKARYNYAEWCEPKGTGMIPAEYRVPGAAVFTGKQAKNIPHVMFLHKPVDADKPEGDWYLIEARGVTYGVVKTRLYSRKPTFWGLMTKYFDYGNAAPEVVIKPETAKPDSLRKGDNGEEVKAAQKLLLKWDAECLPEHGPDGDFGSETEKAVREYQEDKGLEVDGIIGPETLESLKAIQSNPYKEPSKNVKKGFNGNSVRWVQWELLQHNPNCLPEHGPDGDFGSETLKTVKAFQKAHNLDADGIVGELTRAALKNA